MSVTAELWTCPTCGVTERLEGETELARSHARTQAQTGHGARHEAEAAQALPLVQALAAAVDAVTRNRVRLVVAREDVDRVRGMLTRRELPIDVQGADPIEPGFGYVVQPRQGVRRR